MLPRTSRLSSEQGEGPGAISTSDYREESKSWARTFPSCFSVLVKLDVLKCTVNCSSWFPNCNTHNTSYLSSSSFFFFFSPFLFLCLTRRTSTTPFVVYTRAVASCRAPSTPSKYTTATPRMSTTRPRPQDHSAVHSSFNLSSRASHTPKTYSPV